MASRLNSGRVLVLSLVLLGGCVAGGKEMRAAASRGDMDELTTLVKDQRAAINDADKWGYTPLMCAVSNHRVEAVKLLLDAGAETELKDRKGLMTAEEMARANVRICTPEYLAVQRAFMEKQGVAQDEIEWRIAQQAARLNPEAKAQWEEIVVLLSAKRE